jgi:hypothetical protein
MILGVHADDDDPGLWVILGDCERHLRRTISADVSPEIHTQSQLQFAFILIAHGI